MNNQWNIEDGEEGCQGFFVAFFVPFSFFYFFLKKIDFFFQNIKVNIPKYFVSIFLGTDFLSVEYN